MDAPYVFAVSDFNSFDTDECEHACVRIVSLACDGSLRFDHDEVYMGQMISKADMDTGKFTFIPATAWNGVTHDSFLFKIDDGESSSRVAYTMTLNILSLEELDDQGEPTAKEDDVDPDVDPTPDA